MNVGEYRLLEKIGSGGSANVFKCINLNSNKEFCIKELDICFKDFWTEAYLLRKLSHNLIPKAIDLIGFKNKVYLIMTLLDGVPPHSIKLSLLSINKLMLDMAGVLYFLHSQNPRIIYCDFKPSNILYGNKNYLIDFGLAKEEGSDFFRNMYSFGTRKYMDPLVEIENYKPSISSDIYSWARTYIELLKINNIVAPKKLNCILHRGLSEDLKFRYSSFKYVIRDLRRLF